MQTLFDRMFRFKKLQTLVGKRPNDPIPLQIFVTSKNKSSAHATTRFSGSNKALSGCNSRTNPSVWLTIKSVPL